MSANVPRGARLETPTPTEELHIIRKLGLRPDFFCGLTTPAERGAKLRQVLDEKRVGRIPVWRGRDEDWNSACLRWYGVGDLTPTDQPQPETVSP